MATKPVTSPRVWDSAGVYTTGPFVGSISISDPGAGIAAEGHRPGNLYPTAAEHENYQQNKITAYVANWLALGSSAGAADAHIVETDAAGRATLHGLNVNDLVDETAVDITSTSTFAPAVSISCSTGAQGLSVNLGGAAAVGVSSNVGNGAGVGLSSEMIGSPAGARGVMVTADATTDGVGLGVTHEGAGDAVEILATGAGDGLHVDASGGGIGKALVVTGNATSTALTITGSAVAAVQITGGSSYALLVGAGTDARGAYIQGNGAGDGALILGGATAGAHAIVALAQNATGNAINASSANTSSAPAIFAQGYDSAPGISANAAGHYALLANGDTTSPAYAAIFVNPQGANPTTVANGAITYNGASAQWVIGSTADAAFRGLWSSRAGFCYGAEYGARATNANAAVYTALAVAALSAGNVPKIAGAVITITVALRVRTTTSGTPTTCDIQLVDSVDGTIVTFAGSGSGATAGYYLPGTTTDWATTINLVHTHTCVAAGARNITLNFKRAGAISIEAQGSLVVTGGY
jgi:hypothetical protein